MTKEEVAAKFSGYIDKDTEVNGELNFKESFRIDGKFSGKILTGNHLVIGENGHVEADIKVVNLSVSGQFKGTAEVKQKIEVFSRGRITGQLITSSLMIEDGAFFQGSCQMEIKALENKKGIQDPKTGSFVKS